MRSREPIPSAGVLLCLLPLFVFACEDTVTKVLAQSHSILQVIMVRYRTIFLQSAADALG